MALWRDPCIGGYLSWYENLLLLAADFGRSRAGVMQLRLGRRYAPGSRHRAKHRFQDEREQHAADQPKPESGTGVEPTRTAVRRASGQALPRSRLLANCLHPASPPKVKTTGAGPRAGSVLAPCLRPAALVWKGARLGRSPFGHRLRRFDVPDGVFQLLCYSALPFAPQGVTFSHEPPLPTFAALPASSLARRCSLRPRARTTAGSPRATLAATGTVPPRVPSRATTDGDRSRPLPALALHLEPAPGRADHPYHDRYRPADGLCLSGRSSRGQEPGDDRQAGALTPTGHFSIIGKDIDHKSNLYGYTVDEHGNVVDDNANAGEKQLPARRGV